MPGFEASSVFTGTRTHHLTPQPTGPFAGLITRSIPDLGPSFVRFGNGLKRRVESSTA